METITQRQIVDVDKDFERIRKNIIIPLEELYPLDKMVKCAREEYLITIGKYTYENLKDKTADELYELYGYTDCDIRLYYTHEDMIKIVLNMQELNNAVLRMNFSGRYKWKIIKLWIKNIMHRYIK